MNPTTYLLSLLGQYSLEVCILRYCMTWDNCIMCIFVIVNIFYYLWKGVFPPPVIWPFFFSNHGVRYEVFYWNILSQNTVYFAKQMVSNMLLFHISYCKNSLLSLWIIWTVSFCCATKISTLYSTGGLLPTPLTLFMPILSPLLIFSQSQLPYLWYRRQHP